MRHNIESCDQGGEDQDKTWLKGPVASVKGKLSDDLAPMDRSNGEEQVEIKIDEPIRSHDDIKWIISLLIMLVHVLHRHWRRWNEMRKAKV